MSTTSLKDLSSELFNQFPHEPTQGQTRLVEAFSRFLLSEKPRCALIIKGYAGTGKTTSVGAIVGTLRKQRSKFCLLAPTGRAAKVMSAYSGEPASTIHRRIYLPKKSKDGTTGFTLGVNKFKNTLFIVDEASMIGSDNGLLDDLLSYVYMGTGCRLILVGDSAQLPPVGCKSSPALDEQNLRTSYSLTIATVELTEVVRQELNSSILFNAHNLRLSIGNSSSNGATPHPRFDLDAGPDLVSLSGNDLQETLETLHGKYGEDGVVVITRSNKRAVQFNQQIRSRILWQEEDINVGDKLMVVRNNYYWLREYDDFPIELIANGDILEVTRIHDRFTRYGREYAEVDIRLLDYIDSPDITVVVMLSLLNDPKANLPLDEQKELYRYISDDYYDLGSKSKIHSAVVMDKCYQALQVKYAYSITCHKAQGGQWPAIILDQGYLTEDMIDKEWLRWLYTGMTRAESELFLLNFNTEFYTK